MFFGKGVLKICSKITEELYILLDICSPINLLRIFRAPVPKNTYKGLLFGNAQLINYGPKMFDERVGMIKTVVYFFFFCSYCLHIIILSLGFLLILQRTEL